MKNLKNIIIFILAMLICFSCSKNEKLAKGTIQFTCTPSALKALNIDSDTIRLAIISIVDGSGNVIYDKYQLPLYNMGGQYLSSQLSLNVGDYYITEFMIANSWNKILYATPKAGSPKANLVKNPLSISFKIYSNSTTHIIPEVLSIDNNTPADFGYAVFGFVIVPNVEPITIIGKWNWIKSVGGVSGGGMTPSSIGYNKTIEFLQDSTCKEYMNDSLVFAQKYFLTVGKSIYSKDSAKLIKYKYDPTQSYILKGSDTLILRDEMYDGFESTYIRKN